MGFKECLISAVDQGAINRAEAQELSDAFDAKFAQLKLSMPEGSAKATAKIELEKELRFQALEQKRRTRLSAQAQTRLKTHVQGFRDINGRPDVFEAVLSKLEHFGTGMTTSVAGKTKAIIALAHGELTDVIGTFRRTKLLGKRLNRPTADALARELLGAPGNDPAVKAMAAGVNSVFEKLRTRFNAAGGAIGKLENYLPQAHDATALLKVGKAKWKEAITPLLDRGKMRDPLTGGPLTDARLDQVLDYTWSNIATDGAFGRKPKAQRFGAGALASQRADHRFLLFKDADSWLKYARDFGEPDPIRAIFTHINGMASDIAAMEELGPNPSATIEWLKQIVQNEAAKSVAGQPSLFNGKSRSLQNVADAIPYTAWRIDAVWQNLRGRNVVGRKLAAGVSSLRNVLTSAQLGAAALGAAVGDPFFDALARRLSGLPIGGAFTAIAKTWSTGTRMQAVRAGMIMDDFLHILQDQARFAGMIGGSEWSKWLADRTMKLSGLEPMTQARKHVFALEFMGALADQADRPLDQVDPMLRRWMEGYGIDATDWNVIRSTPIARPHNGSAGYLQPSDIAGLVDGPALPAVQKLLGVTDADEEVAREMTRAGVTRIAEKVIEMIQGQTERAVPSGTVRARSFVTGAAQRGTLAGELLESFLQYKSFGLSLTTLQLQAIQTELNVSAARGAGYAGALLITATLAGAMSQQLRAISAGKDPARMDDPRFWVQSAATGGGFGIFGDFLFADTSRFGHSLAETVAGPVVGFANDVGAITTGNLYAGLFGKNVDAGADLTKFAARYTPIASSLWYARAAYKRVLLDQLQYLVDPSAHRRFRDQEKRAAKDSGQGFWWRPGSVMPSRAPDLSTAF